MGALGGERAACGDEGETQYVPPARALVRPATLTGLAGQCVPLGLAVQIGDPGLGDLAVDGGVHLGLPVTRLDFLPPASPGSTAPVSRRADTTAVSLLTSGLPAAGGHAVLRG